MKILVAIKRVPAPEQRIHIGANGRIDDSGLSFVINQFDAIAIEEALRIRERGLPAVITADLRLNEPRYASLPSIIKAHKKPIEFTTANDLGVVLERRVEIVQLEAASSARTCVRVKDVAELVHRLRHEAKVV